MDDRSCALGSAFEKHQSGAAKHERSGLKELEIENRHRTLLAVAFDSGFSSKSSFNRVFQQIAEYRPGSGSRALGLGASEGDDGSARS